MLQVNKNALFYETIHTFPQKKTPTEAGIVCMDGVL